ncbi:MAG: hypothetical protein RR493_07815, partial [Erysipelotrichaceae bacterium]
AQMAKELFKIEHVIARLYDPERVCIYKEFNIETICPALLSVKEINKLLDNRPKLIITTSFKNKQVQEEKLYSDFRQLDEFKNFFINYFEDQLSQKMNLHISRSKIDHP